MNGITEGPDGNLWFVGRDPPLIERILSHAPYTVKQFAVPTDDSYVSDIIAVPDGNLWFTEQGDFRSEGAKQPGKVGRILARPPYTITEFNLADPTSNRARAFQIVVGPDRNLYFTEVCTLGVAAVPSCPAGAGSIGRLTPFGSDAQIQASVIQVAQPAPCSPAVCNSLSDITVGPDRNLWFTDNTNIGRLHPWQPHDLTEYPVGSSTVKPPFLTTGPDGNLWFTGGPASNNFGRISPRDPDDIRLFTASATNTAPNTEGIITGPDGRLWFAEYTNNVIATFSPYTPEHVTEYTLPVANSSPRSLTLGPCHSIWFTAQAGLVGRIDVRRSRLDDDRSGWFGIPTLFGFSHSDERCGTRD
ncbi:MAG: hypothetical protein JO023_03695 [Chloroflexi bacterium]|nr:hypothetical protein [Chloroflexota bacterium]